MSPTPRRLLAGLTATATALVAAPVLAAGASPGAADRPDGTARPGMTDRAQVLGTSPNDRYIVVFDKDTRGAAMRSARAEAVENGARVYQRFGAAIEGFAATLPDRALESLRKNPRVDFIEPDRLVRLAETQSPATWGIDRIDQRDRPMDNSFTYSAGGAGVTAYVIDTGIRTSHSEFSGRAVAGYTAINDGRGSSDCNGHGTHVAGTVGGETYGVAQDVRLVAVRVLDCQGSGSTSGVIAGVDWVTSHHTSGPAVANMSLGGGVSSALDQAVTTSINDGISYAVAAGNENADACGGSPSRVGAALTVGSSTNTDSRSSFSNYGSCVDLFAPGSSITSAWHTSDTVTNTISGTSMASPHVAGAAAAYLQANPSASPAAVASALVGNASTNRLTGVNGSPNRLLYTGTGGGTTPPPSGCDAMPGTVRTTV